MDAPVFALGDLAADGTPVVDLVAIAAQIEPSGIRILRDHAIRGADVTRLVLLVVPRHGKLKYVDRRPFDDVLKHRTVFHPAWWQRPHALQALVVPLDDVHLALVGERQP